MVPSRPAPPRGQSAVRTGLALHQLGVRAVVPGSRPGTGVTEELPRRHFRRQPLEVANLRRQRRRFMLQLLDMLDELRVLELRLRYPPVVRVS